MSWHGTILFPGEADGEVLRFDAPISFWGGVDPASARITMSAHPQFGEIITDKIMVIPSLIGSSSSSAIVLELLYRHIAPRALVLGCPDAILPVGVLVAKQMGWPTMPMIALGNPPFLSGDRISIRSDGQVLVSTRS